MERFVLRMKFSKIMYFGVYDFHKFIFLFSFFCCFYLNFWFFSVIHRFECVKYLFNCGFWKWKYQKFILCILFVEQMKVFFGDFIFLVNRLNVGDVFIFRNIHILWGDKLDVNGTYMKKMKLEIILGIQILECLLWTK